MEDKSMTRKRYLMLALLAWGGGVIFLLPYLRWTFYEPMREVLGVNHTQYGFMMSVYGFTALVTYWPGGWLADRISARRLLTFSFTATGLLGFWFATYPPYEICVLIHILWGFTTLMTFWATMNKATKELAGPDAQGRFFGFLEGGRGVTSLGFNLGFSALFAYFGGKALGVTVVLYLSSVISVATGILTWFVFKLPEGQEEQETASQEKRSAKEDLKEVITNPLYWGIAMVIFCGFNVSVLGSYMTPYLTEYFGVTAAATAVIASFRIYGLQMVCSPLSGVIVDKTGHVAKNIFINFAVVLVFLVGFIFLPPDTKLLIPAVAAMMIMYFALNMSRGVYYALFDEIGTPAAISGTAIGFAALIGYSPDAFFYTIAGWILDHYPGTTGYKILFAADAAILGCGLIMMIFMVKRIQRIKNHRAAKVQA